MCLYSVSLSIINLEVTNIEQWKLVFIRLRYVETDFQTLKKS